nr:metallopeptidase [Candidatus Woesebacteria bacterium]
MRFVKASDIQKRIEFLVHELEIDYIKAENLVCFRSFGSTGRARARIWSMPTIWQIALSIEPHYCIEVISEKFDNQSLDDQERILIHELMHIPKTFSGALVPHRTHKH